MTIFEKVKKTDLKETEKIIKDFILWKDVASAFAIKDNSLSETDIKKRNKIIFGLKKEFVKAGADTMVQTLCAVVNDKINSDLESDLKRLDESEKPSVIVQLVASSVATFVVPSHMIKDDGDWDRWNDIYQRVCRSRVEIQTDMKYQRLTRPMSLEEGYRYVAYYANAVLGEVEDELVEAESLTDLFGNSTTVSIMRTLLCRDLKDKYMPEGEDVEGEGEDYGCRECDLDLPNGTMNGIESKRYQSE